MLLVEDERSLGRLVQAYLERAGFPVVWARSGEEALDALASRPVRLELIRT